MRVIVSCCRAQDCARESDKKTLFCDVEQIDFKYGSDVSTILWLSFHSVFCIQVKMLGYVWFSISWNLLRLSKRNQTIPAHFQLLYQIIFHIPNMIVTFNPKFILYYHILIYSMAITLKWTTHHWITKCIDVASLIQDTLERK